ncbi:MAG TPA: ribosomal protein S18-alanine N-acetyltransferase [Segeticoccus sp.]|nr:ribosomal protein S18-alanine N-acetyltransferase [Segeticoccus sp.]
MTLRDLRWPDIPRLAALETELFGADAWSERTWWAELAARPRRSYVVAVEEDRPEQVTGYAGLDLAGEVADVMTVAVAPDARGRGVGATLVRWLVSRARACGAAYLMLEVRADNQPARALYDRFGFRQLHVRRRYYQPGDVDALVLRADLRDGDREPRDTEGDGT